MRAYFFGNYYLSSIQQGIQAAHCMHDLFVKYQKGPEKKVLFDWAENHKTMICLNGGNSADLLKVYAALVTHGAFLKLPHGNFFEDKISLNKALTCVGIVVPEKIYTIPDPKLDVDYYEWKDVVAPGIYGDEPVPHYHEYQLAAWLRSAQLAR